MNSVVLKKTGVPTMNVVNFVANTMEDNNVKRAVFLSVVGDTTYQLICGILSPKKLTEVDFSDILRTLTSHYNPKRNAIVERFKFNTM